MSTFPYSLLLETIEPRGGFSEVWYEIIPEEAAKVSTVGEGDYVTLLARVAAVRRAGGYDQGGPPPGTNETPPIEKRTYGAKVFLHFDPSEIYLIRLVRRAT